ncbi:hypothetical protein PoB_004083900 [Plakobranchus ocellatus]|uniref:Uncharacterized protein n=1 Tax=Plakobranchus ocellatus TaxID=259542 RepID=A0AAV4B6L2_9GAST|nr:hypothetical protein PoB_004083900 [Plakobranchus ocellatus]
MVGLPDAFRTSMTLIGIKTGTIRVEIATEIVLVHGRSTSVPLPDAFRTSMTLIGTQTGTIRVEIATEIVLMLQSLFAALFISRF